MTRTTPTALGRELVRFFEDFLPVQRGVSPHTLRSYRDAVLLLLQFAARDARRPLERLDIPDLSAERVTRFLAALEAGDDRHQRALARTRRSQHRDPLAGIEPEADTLEDFSSDIAGAKRQADIL